MTTKTDAIAQKPVDWDVAKRITDLPEVDEMLQGFIEDPTGDNGVEVVRAVLQASGYTAPQPPTIAQPHDLQRAVDAYQIAEQACIERHSNARNLIEPGIAIESGLLAAAQFLVPATARTGALEGWKEIALSAIKRMRAAHVGCMDIIDKAESLLEAETATTPPTDGRAQQDVSTGLEIAAAWLEKRAADYDDDHGSTDHETGAREYPGEGADYYNELMENAESIRALKTSYGNDIVMGDLVALVKQLVRALHKAAPNSDLPKMAMDYLTRKGLQGSPLRASCPGLALCIEQLAEGAKLVIVVLDELLAEHGDLPIGDALADRLIESVGLLDRAQSALASARGESSSHV